MAILVIKHSALGDMILALPLFRAIRRHHPGERIVLLTTAPYVELTRASGSFDEIWTDDRPKLWQLGAMLHLWRRLRSEDFTRIYDLQGSQRTSQIYYRLMGAPRDRWVGNAKGCLYHIPDPVVPVHIAEHRRRQLALVGIPDPGLPDLSFLQADTAQYGLPARYALLVPGGSPHRPAKRWPAEAFADLATHLAGQGITPVLIGQQAEQQAIGQIAAACPAAISLLGRTSIAAMATLARRAEIAVGNDTGPMHIIAAAGCPSLVLYSAESDPRKVSPRGDWVRLLQRPSLQDLAVTDAIAALPPPRGGKAT
jgi:ADP-heptose:LPS heptosyltransferase